MLLVEVSVPTLQSPKVAGKRHWRDIFHLNSSDGASVEPLRDL